MLVGSRALAHWVTEFKCKPNADWDFIGEQSVDVPSDDKVEIHSLDSLNNRDALGFSKGGVCSLYGLTLIKRSHLHRDYKFDRHITMYHKYLLPTIHGSNHGVGSFNALCSGLRFLKERTTLTKKEFPQGAPPLKQTNDSFFDDAVEKVFEHDWLHELYAYRPMKPMYEKLKKPDNLSMAWCEKDLWLDLSYEDKVKCVAEGCYVIATERFLVPEWVSLRSPLFSFPYPPKLAYLQALRKVCTTLTSGWFRDFAIDNYPAIVALYDYDKVKQVQKELIK